MVADALKPAPGTDLAEVKPGVTREQVEKALGEPEREWTTPLNVHYRTYRYLLPQEHGSAVQATGLVLADFASLGLAEVIVAASKDPVEKMPNEVRTLAIAFDDNDTVLGVFKMSGEFDPLPDDGRK